MGRELSGIKVGDEVALCAQNGAWFKAKVSRVTRTQVEADGSMFRLKDGRMVGSSSWSFCGIHPLTPETERAIRETQLRRWKRDAVLQIKAKVSESLPIETLKAIKELIAKEPQ